MSQGEDYNATADQPTTEQDQTTGGDGQTQAQPRKNSTTPQDGGQSPENYAKKISQNNQNQEVLQSANNMGSTGRTFGSLQTTTKEQYKMLMSGMSSLGASGADNDMMKAMIHQKKVEDEKAQIQSRIIKLRKEEEKANKRIRDLQKRQEFVTEMHATKTGKINAMANLQNHHKMVEDTNRQRFNEERNKSKSSINFNITNCHQRNRSTFVDIKEQQRKIEDLINNNRDNFLKEKQRAYTNVKDVQIRAKSNANSNQNCDYSNIQAGYVDRIKERYDDASNTQSISKQLEQQEAALLNKLQKTYQTEKKMVESLYKTNAQSPIKPAKPNAIVKDFIFK